jgi:predicted nucleic acid-binding protein
LREFLTLFTVIDLTDPIMERFARIRYQLRTRGNLIPDFDLIVAATALELDLTLLTFNVRHFERIAGLALYSAT